MFWFILFLIIVLSSLFLKEEKLYNCRKCKTSYVYKTCNICGNINGYADRHSDSSMSVKNTIKHFKK